MSKLYDRLEALLGQRHKAEYYGGWYVVDTFDATWTPVESMEQAVTLAEQRGPNGHRRSMDFVDVLEWMIISAFATAALGTVTLLGAIAYQTVLAALL